jgi:hypothetical protein
MTGISHSFRVVVALGALIFAGQSLATDVYKGTAKFTAADGKRAEVTVTISLDAPTPEAERAALVEQARANTAGIKAALAGQKQLGYIEARDVKVPIRYAYLYAGGDGLNMILLSDEPLGFIGGKKRSAKAKPGFDLTYVMVSFNANGNGRGEMAPAGKIKFMESGAPAVEDYGAHVVWLDDVSKAK